MFTVPKEKLENYNFSVPLEIAEEFRRIGDVHGERNKLRWAVASAAVLKLLEMPEAEMHALIQRVAGARSYPETLAAMVAAAKLVAAGVTAQEPERGEIRPAKGKGKPVPRDKMTRSTGGVTKIVP